MATAAKIHLLRIKGMDGNNPMYVCVSVYEYSICCIECRLFGLEACETYTRLLFILYTTQYKTQMFLRPIMRVKLLRR